LVYVFYGHLVYVFYGHLVYVFYGHLVYVGILWPFGIFSGCLVYISRFGIL
jgi:hypothetical protein